MVPKLALAAVLISRNQRCALQIPDTGRQQVMLYPAVARFFLLPGEFLHMMASLPDGTAWSVWLGKGQRVQWMFSYLQFCGYAERFGLRSCDSMHAHTRVSTRL